MIFPSGKYFGIAARPIGSLPESLILTGPARCNFVFFIL